MAAVESEMIPFYKNKTIFITGGSGFVGRVTIEKLLRVTEVHRIYVLIRPKRGKEIQDRIAAWSSDPLFEVLLKSNCNALDKVIAIPGDCLEPDLGISLKDRQILTEQVQLVVHSAATVRFVEPLHQALDINTRATRLMLQLAKEMNHLESFVYVSTAFSNCVTPHIGEMYYPDHLNCSVDKVLQLREMLDDDVIDRMAPALLDKFPNTYVYTKALSEQLILTESDKLPVCIFRPGILLGTAKEPIVGWIDNLYGPMAIIHGSACGILRIVPANKNTKLWAVPVDNCGNVLLSSCWKTAQLSAQGKSQLQPIIYNYVPHENNNVYIGDFKRVIERERVKCAVENGVWYPFMKYVTIPWLYKLAIFFYHLLPGYILDIILRLKGKKPRLIKLYKKIHMNMDAMSYFMQTSFTVSSTNSNGLWKSMSKEDQQFFPFDLEFIDWENFINQTMYGMRKYIAKQDLTPESFARSLKSIKRLYVYHRTLQITVICIALAIGRLFLRLFE